MTELVYFQRLLIPDAAINAQNFDLTAVDFLPFVVGGYSDNAGGETDEVQVSMALGTLDQRIIEKLIAAGSTAIVSAESQSQVFWRYQGVVTDVTIDLTTISLVIGSPLQPVSAGTLLPGTIPFRFMTTANVGKLPTTGGR